jgi:hypothetical protein
MGSLKTETQSSSEILLSVYQFHGVIFPEDLNFQQHILFITVYDEIYMQYTLLHGAYARRHKHWCKNLKFLNP